ncbi:MAG: NADPH-dependent assimilatory sulfite reductase hemoprotein subunit [Flavobacteriales bacterium]|jgi:sulfite reductase (NADPH) hemoprotein beta-component|uniref:NADPH-dependent assimilatory sulfite reductase hemoprotein subunit n=1 Tax=Blattabacterium sp. (Mastotermes darwiniensis) TaxID=39768 RepID=UPI000231DE48|nr:NADPH-dependent assimilatory sulfite reductase hemoprotein subunit [Blattabacterium sp. (Mastotermes darwiniensis)]AER40636.1 sulfite reductase (NADPH) hemoprotein subunit beta [Blattabacterium sp. (Mastotermes darwiniensis) str. MADAR]MDR1804723.1 NADPH-dependent assimilatory sulfite reductase hemoprotein subunit [Flavobacteriales bacterium]
MKIDSFSNKITMEEKIKEESRGLRGSIIESVKDELSGGISDKDQIIIKFHGLYQQDDRDIREYRAKKKLDRLFSFMIRLRIPGGFIKSKQWLSIHQISEINSTGVIKVTSRQTIQLHGLIKSNIKPTIQFFNISKLDSIATCGDINRNVICSTYSRTHYKKILTYASKISKMFLPKTRAYYEIWLDEKKILEKENKEPIYKKSYLPRKFKIAIAIPPNNDVDVFANDIGLIAIIDSDKKKLKGFNISVGGGLSTTHGNSKTYSRLGTIIGFYDSEEKILRIVYEILTIQRDYGNRSDRKFARLKYTIDNYGIEWFKKELENRIGFSLKKERPFFFTERCDYFGWIQDDMKLWNYTIFIENGLVFDRVNLKLKSALLKIAEYEICNFLFTCNQNITLTDIHAKNKKTIQSILDEYGIVNYMNHVSSIRKNSMACVALNTCPLALAEGQRYFPHLISKIEFILNKYKLGKEEIIIRMTGCPNGCSRPYLAEIGFVGVSYGRYNLYLGGDPEGTRLNKLYKKNMDESSILKELDQFFNCFQKEKLDGEKFGNFSIRKQWVI